MELFPGMKLQSRPADTTETTSASDQKTFSLGPAVSSFEVQQKNSEGPKEVLSPLEPLERPSIEGCYLCGDCKGGTSCSTCGKLACSQHIRVKIDQQKQKALPVCRSCSLMDESSRHTGLETLPLKINELTDGIKALNCLCSSLSAEDGESVKSFQGVIADRLGLSTEQDTAPANILARAAVTMYELMNLLNDTGMINHLPYALVRIHHLQKTLKTLTVKDMVPLIMASPELVRIVNAAQTDPTVTEEVHISGFNVPWERQEMPEIDATGSPGGIVLECSRAHTDQCQRGQRRGKDYGDAAVSEARNGSWYCRSGMRGMQTSVGIRQPNGCFQSLRLTIQGHMQ
eukprot:4930433-Amphidinium_carterae.1